MKVAVTGASGNVGTATVRRLLADPAVTAVVGVARREPAAEQPPLDRVDWVSCDIGGSDAPAQLRAAFAGADAVVHLAWQIQPGHDREQLRRTNVYGSRTVAEAALAAGVSKLVYASSVGAYSAGPKERAVDESWPTAGISSSAYSRQKAAVERMLDEIEADGRLAVTRLRPGLIFQQQAAGEIARYFLGPLFPRRLLRLGVPIVPDVPGLRFQAVHTDDVAAAFALAVTTDVSGAFNIAADPVLDPRVLAGALGARVAPFPIPVGVLRRGMAATWRARLQPTGPGWLDMALGAPIMDTGRARGRLGWAPSRSATEAVVEVVRGMGRRTGGPTPALSTRRSNVSA